MFLDGVATSLTYVADEPMLTGLTFNAAPPENLDGVTVRTAAVKVSRDRFTAHMPASQWERYDNYYGKFSDVQFLVSVGDDLVPRRLIVTVGYGSELDYTNWGTTTVKIDAPVGPQVLVQE